MITLVDQNILSKVLYLISGLVLMFLCSQASIPIQPVPISMQTVGVMLIAFLYNRRDALRIIYSYVILGALGVPLFAGYANGISVILGPTGGYIIGFIACIHVMTKIKDQIGIDRVWLIFLNCMIGTVVIFAFGMVWLTFLFNFEVAVSGGLVPFIIPGLLKSCCLTLFLGGLGIIRQKS